MKLQVAGICVADDVSYSVPAMAMRELACLARGTEHDASAVAMTGLLSFVRSTVNGHVRTLPR